MLHWKEKEEENSQLLACTVYLSLVNNEFTITNMVLYAYLCVDSRLRQTTSNVSGGPEELLPGSGASDPLPNSGHVGSNPVSYTGTVFHCASFS